MKILLDTHAFLLHSCLSIIVTLLIDFSMHNRLPSKCL